MLHALPELREDARVIEIGGDFSLGASLVESGSDRFLGLATSAEALEAARARHPLLATRLVPCESPARLAENNAEILIVSDPAALALGGLRRHRHARTVLWSPARGWKAWRETADFVGSVLFGRLRGRLDLAAARLSSDADGRRRLVLVAKNLARKESTARYFIPPELGVEGFLRWLEERRLHYAVLRWFERLPELPPGEDIDLLVADDDAAEVTALLGARPGLVPCDVYSASGLAGTAYRNMAYYPPALAEEILERAVLFEGRFRVPSRRDHFLSLAYHAVYHKGEASGIASKLVAPSAAPDHDYVGALRELALSLGIEVELSLEALDEFLSAQGWRPPLDTLSRLAGKNRWLALRLGALVPEAGPEYQGIAVFLVRRRAVELGCVEEIEERLSSAGFEVVARKRLSEAEAERVRRHARGGNWGRGPFASSGGPPAVALVAFDPAPLAPTAEERARHPGLENARLLVKTAIRDALNARLSAAERCNLLHSSDNAWGAREYLSLVFGSETAKIVGHVEELRRSARSRRAERRIGTTS